MKKQYEYYSNFSYKDLVDLIESQKLRIEELEYKEKHFKRVLESRDKIIEAQKEDIKKMYRGIKGLIKI